MPSLTASFSDEGDVFRRLKARVLAVNPPETRLRLLDLSAQYETPPGKVREALLRLASEGLIAFEPKRGFSLLPISASELMDVTNLRIELESRALRDSIKSGDDRWETGVLASLHLLSKIEPKSLRDRKVLDLEWTKRHREFHQALIAACGSPWRQRMCVMLSDHAERYRQFSIAARTKSRNIHAEHAVIANAAIGRQADKACALLAEHYMASAKSVIANKQAMAKHARNGDQE